MRPRSLSVACDKSGMISKKFEGVTSDHEDDSDSDDETVEDVKCEFLFADYEKLVSQIRAALPSNDTKKAEYRLKNLDWTSVAFDGHSPDTVKDVSFKLFKSVRKFRSLEELLNDFIAAAKKMILARKPKVPRNPFNFYMKEHYAAYKQAHPELSQKSLFKKMADEYKLISVKKKRKYEQQAEEARRVYKIELEKFYEENPAAIVTKKKKLPARKGERPLKKATPFNLFRREKRKEEGRKLSHTELKALWEKLEFDQKMKYIREGYSLDKSKLTKDEKGLMATALGKPDLVPRTVFEYYLRNHVDKDTTISVLKWRKQAAIEFKKLPKVRKLEVELAMRRARANYVKKYQEYIDKLPAEDKQVEIDFLQSYITGMMDKEEKKQYEGRPMPDLTGCGGHSLHDITDLPIAESTTHEIVPAQKKKSKKKAIPEAAMSNDVSKPLKSILKSPAPVVASPKRKTNDVQASTDATPTKKKKVDQVQVVVDSESDSNAKKGKKKAKKEKDSDDGVDSSQGKLKNGTREDHVPMKEPKRPPKDILKYYKKFHYFGREGKHKDSFDKLSTIRKKSIEAEMRAAQKKYMIDLKMYLDYLPPSEVQSYVTKLQQFITDVGSADEVDSDEVEEKIRKNTSLEKTKPEPTSDSDDDDDLSED
uniref:Uncharacterized protein n=1 Tax=Anopheles atroparvus TaxID=41427 RepID=A0A182J8F3_ANOAO